MTLPIIVFFMGAINFATRETGMVRHARLREP
jgi:hypothetical protein